MSSLSVASGLYRPLSTAAVITGPPPNCITANLVFHPPFFWPRPTQMSSPVCHCPVGMVQITAGDSGPTPHCPKAGAWWYRTTDRSGKPRSCGGASGLDVYVAGSYRKTSSVACMAPLTLVAVLSLTLTSCAGSPSSSSSAKTISAPVFVSRSLPNNAVGNQFRWLLGAVAETPLAQQMIRTHFDSDFLSQVSPNRLNTVLSHVLT